MQLFGTLLNVHQRNKEFKFQNKCHIKGRKRIRIIIVLKTWLFRRGCSRLRSSVRLVYFAVFCMELLKTNHRPQASTQALLLQYSNSKASDMQKPESSRFQLQTGTFAALQLVPQNNKTAP
ncbi:hypothetical protein ILYODFUR_005297 [Ilyodon furcidens]|uniref:Uncharacterized protein n=1 Tax=Ilyodon furcidens TaxID=33524 RepID=A0ABV0SL55_9TELE